MVAIIMSLIKMPWLINWLKISWLINKWVLCKLYITLLVMGCDYWGDIMEMVYDSLWHMFYDLNIDNRTKIAIW